MTFSRPNSEAAAPDRPPVARDLDTRSQISVLLAQWRSGDLTARERLAPLVYGDLRRLAAYHLRKERPDHTLQPTALAHEVWLRLFHEREPHWTNAAHFFAAVAKAMRCLLVDHARIHNAQKRAPRSRVPLKVAVSLPLDCPSELTALDAALRRLAVLDQRQSDIVELRYFGGLTTAEIASVLGASERTVRREWAMAKAWLHSELREFR